MKIESLYYEEFAGYYWKCRECGTSNEAENEDVDIIHCHNCGSEFKKKGNRWYIIKRSTAMIQQIERELNYIKSSLARFKDNPNWEEERNEEIRKRPRRILYDAGLTCGRGTYIEFSHPVIGEDGYKKLMRKQKRLYEQAIKELQHK